MIDKIKEVALKLFATYGYEGTSIRLIGEEVGIKGSSIYSHFKSKEDIFLTLVQELFEDMTFQSEEIIIHNDINDMEFDLKALLFQVFTSYYKYFAEHYYELLFWQRLRFFTPNCLKGKFDNNYLLYDEPIANAYYKLFQRGVESKQVKNVDAGVLVIFFFTYVSGYMDSLILVPFELSEIEIQQSFLMFWEGIKY